MTQNEEFIYVFALRYASGRHTTAYDIVIDEIIRHMKDFLHPEAFIREVEIRNADVERGYNPWDEAGEEKKFVDLEAAILDEIERRKKVEE